MADPTQPEPQKIDPTRLVVGDVIGKQFLIFGLSLALLG